MNRSELERRLRQSVQSDDPASEHQSLIDELAESGAGIEAMEPILRFMEKYPQLDFGVPGPLVHFIETFPDEEYDPKLLASLRRRPTMHTVWLLNRVINGKMKRADRVRLCKDMAAARDHALADEETRSRAQSFLDLHE